MKENAIAKQILVYKTAGKLLNKRIKNKAIPDDLLPKNEKLVKQIQSLVDLGLEHIIHLNDIIEKTNIFKEDSTLDKQVTKIFITELLWGKKAFKHSCPDLEKFNNFTKAIHKVAAEIGATAPKEESEEEEEDESEAVQSKKIKSEDEESEEAESEDGQSPDGESDGGESEDGETPKKKKGDSKISPRYVQIVKKKQSVEEALAELSLKGWKLVLTEKDDYDAFLLQVKNLKENEFTVDIHLEDVFVFNSAAKFKNIDFSKGFLAVRKTSLLPTLILNPKEGNTVLDMCAGAGINAVRLGAAMGNKGKVFSIQEDKEMLNVFKDTIKSSGLSNIMVKTGEAYKFFDADFGVVDYILVDPNKVPIRDSEREERITYARLLLKHALSSFCKAQRVVYTTQTKNKENNENFVHRMISQTPYYKLSNASELLKGVWKNTGGGDNEVVGSRCIYSLQETDFTNTCFIAVFDRLKDGEKNDLIGTFDFKTKKRKNRMRDTEAKKVKLENEEESETAVKEENEEAMDVDDGNEHVEEEVANGLSDDDNKLVINEDESVVEEEDKKSKQAVGKKVKKNKKKGNKNKSV